VRSPHPEDEASRPGVTAPERLKRETNACDSLILRRNDRTSTRPQRRLYLLLAMGASS
jgi:hypothetical protein